MLARIFAILSLGTVLFAPSAFAKDVWVNPYVTSNGTYVEGHYRSAPDGDPSNNWTTQGNVNPYTGEQGTRNPYNSRPLVPESAPRSESSRSTTPDPYTSGEPTDWNAPPRGTKYPGY